MGYFPYAPRPFQVEATTSVEQTCRKGGHLILESPTGTGKTVTLLAGALAGVEGTRRKILLVTRTNSQQEQAVREIISIRRSSGRPIRCYPLQGRARLCLKLEDAHDRDWEEATPEELSHYCTNAKTRTETDPADPNACAPYAGLLRHTEEDLLERVGPDPRTAEDFKAVGRQFGFCSYEATKRLLPAADVVVAPYVFAFNAGLRQRLLQWWGVAQEDVVLLVDEAHNLPGFLRESSSPRLSQQRLRRALAEAEELGNPLVLRDVTARALLEALGEALQDIVLEYCRDEDAFIPPFELEAALLGRFRVTSHTLASATDHLAVLGETLKDRRRLLGRVPRSELAHVATFLRQWWASDEEGHVKLAIRKPRPALEAFLVDAARAATTLQEFHATVHASGTLAPLEEYRDAVGLGDSVRLERYPSPFPPERLQILVTQGLSTKYERLKSDPRLVDRLQETTRGLLEKARVSVAVFFPSYQMLEEFVEVGVLPRRGHEVLVETRDLSQEALMRLIQAHREGAGRSILAGVVGGRLSEGMDFPGRQLEAMILVGAPYPKPTARQRALFQYFEARHGRGWEYAVKAPTIRRIRQALGRLIRGPGDRGFAVILDERAGALVGEAGLAYRMETPEAVAAAWDAWQSSLVAQDPGEPGVRYV